MPLCTIKIPRDKYDGIPLEIRDEIILSAGNKALDKTLNGLRIPDLEDREMRVFVGKDVAETEMSLSFTVGPNEYPDFAPDHNVFFPTGEDIHNVGVEIQSEAYNSPLEVSATKMEAWSNTTFMICSPESVENTQPDNLEIWKEIGKEVAEPKLTLVLSQEMCGQSSSSKEGEPSRETDFQSIAEKLHDITRECLGIQESTEGSVDVVIAHEADVSISVEFDCQPKEGVLIQQEHREYAGRRIENILNSHGLVEEGNAEIWIRQGHRNPYIYFCLSVK